MRRAPAILALVLALMPSSSPPPAVAAPTDRRLVVLELFTSEGCSSCPPADAVLRSLEQEQPVPGALVVALEEHVDYWDEIGWPDPFSSSQLTARQRAYGRAFGLRSIYTPQLVVDGVTEVLGSDRKAVLAAVAQRAAAPALALSAKLVAEHLEVEVASPPVAARLQLAITESGHVTDVLRGENAGETLHHGAVVRSLRSVGALVAGAPFRGSVPLPPPSSPPFPRRAVLFVEAAEGAPSILGAAIVALP